MTLLIPVIVIAITMFRPICAWVRQKFGNILVRASLHRVYHVTEVVQAMVGTCYG